MRRVKHLVAAALAVTMLALSAAPASAQGYTGWIEHPIRALGSGTATTTTVNTGARATREFGSRLTPTGMTRPTTK